MSTSSYTILFAGLKVPENINTPFGTTEQIIGKINADMEAATKAGFDCHIYQMDTNNSAEATEGFEAKVKSRKFDGIMFGAGIRLLPENTALLESCINICRKMAPESIIMFNTGPDTHCQALMRHFDVRF